MRAVCVEIINRKSHRKDVVLQNMYLGGKRNLAWLNIYIKLIRIQQYESPNACSGMKRKNDFHRRISNWKCAEENAQLASAPVTVVVICVTTTCASISGEVQIRLQCSVQCSVQCRVWHALSRTFKAEYKTTFRCASMLEWVCCT